MVLFLDQYPQLIQMINENEFLVDYDQIEMYCFFKNYIEGIREIHSKENYAFVESTLSFEQSIEQYFEVDRELEWFNEIYYGALNLIQEFYDEIFDENTLLIQSGYSEGIIFITSEEFEKLEDYEKDSI
jgi:hypothetical protein